MTFALAATVASHLIVLDETGSTNDDLARRAAEGSLPEFTVVATTTQTAGRGRLGRSWEAPAETSLACSVLLRPQDGHIDREAYGWIPLIAGLAMSRAVSELVPDREVSLKWPNDVLIDGKKVSGLLSELLPDGSIVVGAGVNLTIPLDALPVPTASSLMLMGAVGSAPELADLVLTTYLRGLTMLWKRLATAPDQGGRHDIRNAVTAVCSTLGKPIRLSLPDGMDDYGTALDLDDAGQLRFRRDADGSVQTVAAGDVTHLRYE